MFAKTPYNIWSRRDLNTQPPDLESGALPLRHETHIYVKRSRLVNSILPHRQVENISVFLLQRFSGMDTSTWFPVDALKTLKSEICGWWLNLLIGGSSVQKYVSKYVKNIVCRLSKPSSKLSGRALVLYMMQKTRGHEFNSHRRQQ